MGMKVWIVLHVWPYQGTDVVSVHATEAGADAFIAVNTPPPRVDEHGNHLPSATDPYFEVQTWEVGE